jgi:predicted transcriptional regulator
LSVNIKNVEEFLISELKLTKEESKTFLFLVTNGRKDVKKIAESLESSEKEASNVADSLVAKGMIINISQEYESLHPRFAVSNRYRRRCQEDNIPFGKNLLIDNIGIILERPFEHARTK